MFSINAAQARHDDFSAVSFPSLSSAASNAMFHHICPVYLFDLSFCLLNIPFGLDSSIHSIVHYVESLALHFELGTFLDVICCRLAVTQGGTSTVKYLIAQLFFPVSVFTLDHAFCICSGSKCSACPFTTTAE